MFRRFDIRPPRLILWLLSPIAYWLLIIFAWAETRLRVFMGYEIFLGFTARKKIADILSDMPGVTQRAYEAMAEAGPFPAPLMAVPVLMAVTMFLAPYFVRRDNRHPFTGVIMVPLMTFISYLLAMLVNAVVAASAEIGLHFWLGVEPGPDFFIFLLHPLYLLWPPAMGSIAGLISQLVYILFIASMLTVRPATSEDEETAETPSRDEPADPREAAISTEDGIDACIMETDRLCRMLTSRFGNERLAIKVRRGITAHISDARKIDKELSDGAEPYKIILLEAAKTLRMAIDEDGDTQTAPDMFLYIIEEMEKMEYCSQKDADILKRWAALKKT